jgi:deazaflavin-dependent oxidoreductase (nitroreductase family)
MAHYQKPSYFRSRVVDRFTATLVRRFGLRRTGIEVLTVPGRRTGRPNSVPVFPLDHDGRTFLVCPRGESDWVKNLRVAGTATLERKGQRTAVSAIEVVDSRKPPILAAYLKRWGKLVGSYFGVGADATHDELAGIAPRHPIFAITPMEIA